MIVSQHEARLGRIGRSLARARSLLLLLCSVCIAPIAAAQLKVGQPIDFGSTPVSNALSINVVFSAATATAVTSASVLTDGATGADFTLGANSCTGTIAQNTTCSVSVTFTPKQVGVRHGALLLYNSGGLINQVFLHGIGTGGAFAFAPANVTANTSAPALSPATFTVGSAVQDGYGNLYFTDVQNGRILLETPTGTISQVATLAVTGSSTVVIGADGTLFVSAGNAVYAFQPGATPTPLATGGITLTTPTGLAVDATGDLYIADAATGQISMFSMTAAATTAVAITGLTPALSSPKGLALDATGNLYVADSGNDRVVEIAAGSGRATVLAVSGLTLNNPTGLTLDPAATVYIADAGNSRIVEITVNGVGFALSDPNLALKTPTGVLMKPNGDLIVGDTADGLVLVPRSLPSVKFPTPTLVGTRDSTDGAIALSLQATGNSVAQLVFPTSGTEPTISSAAFALTNAGSCPSINQGNPYTPLQFSIGDICTYTIDFTPTVDGLNSATLQVDISLPGGSPEYTTTVPLSGIGLSTIASFTLVAAPSSTTLGAPISLTLTAVNAANGVAADYTGTVTFSSTDSTSIFLSGKTFTFTAAEKGVLAIPAAAGVSFNQRGTFFVHATDGTFSATSNQITVLDASTVSSFTSSVNPSVPNQTTTLLATVASASPGGPVPTGTVSFYNAGVLIGTATLVNGVAQLNTSFPTPGTYPLTAVYSGDSNTAGSSSGVLNQVVVFVTTATSFTSSINPSLVGQNTVLTLTVSSTGPAPTGTVKFYDNGTLIGTGTVANGAASATVSFAAAGTHPLTAVYSGDANNATVSATLAQLVVQPVTITLASSINPSLVGQQTTLSVTVTSSNAAPTGTVKIYDGTTLLGTLTLANGAATLPATFTTTGIHPLTAVYSGDRNNVGQTSAPYAQDVVTPTTVVRFTSSVNPSLVGQSTVLTLALAGTGGTPTGTVKFYNGATLLGTGTVVNGIATLPVSFPAIGSYPLTAVYSGDTTNAAITAGPLTQIVVALAPAVTLASAVNPSLVGQNTTLTATLSLTTATGTIGFYDGTTLIGTGTIANGAALLTVSFSTAGIHTLTAVYSGDMNDPTAISAPYAQDVVTPAIAASFTSSVNPSQIGQNTTLTVTLAGTSGTPTGTVSFYDGTTLIGTGTVANGIATLTTSFATVGIHPLQAVYSGDTANATVTAGPLNQIVVTAGTIVLSSSSNPSLVNQSVTLTADLGTTTATGTVSFYDGATLLGTGTVANGAATLAATFTTTGIHTLTAVYSGDASNPSITSAPYLQDVVRSIGGSPGSSAVLTSSVNPTTVGQSTTFTLTLTTTGPAPTGTVKFYSGTALLGTGTIANGVATLASSFAAPGTYAITAVYSGDSNYATLTAGPLSQVVVSSTTVILTSSINPSLVNQNTTLTAFLGSNTATGAVKFFNGATLMGSGNVSNGVATMIASFPVAGVQTLTASYPGDGSNPPASSAPYLQDVVTPTIVAAFTSSVNPSTIGQSTVLTVALAGTGTAQPTGTVKFYDGTTLIGAGTVANGVATLTASFAAIGTHPLTAVYSGDTNNATITAGPLNQIVTASVTGIGLTSSVNPVLLHANTQLTATLSPATAAGTVSFFDGTTLVGTGTVSGGIATLAASFSTVGLHALKAVYSGDANDTAATSAAYSEDVQNPDSTVLTTSLTPALVNQAVTLTATITSAGQTPAGTVQFYDGTTLIGTATAANGVAQFATAFTTLGTHTLTCKYLGDTNDAPATCAAISEVVEDPSSMTLSSSLNPSIFGQNVTFTATVTTAGPTPTGSVSFYNGSTLLATITLAPGSSVATYATTTLPVGSDAIKAVYSGDPNTPTASAALTQVVLNPATIAFACPASPLPINTPVTLSATVNSTGLAPTGTVKFFDGTTLLGTGTLANGVATISASFTAIGAHSLTAAYSGDANNGAVTSTACALQVVDPATIVLASSKNPSVVNQSVTFTATIGSAGPTPTGTVRFFNGSTLLGTGTLTGGATSVAFTFTLQGTYPITAVYSGDTNTGSVTSGTLSQVVLNVATITLTSSVNPIFLNNQTVLTATATSTGITPTGLVTFFDGAAPIGNATLVNGVAALSFTFPSTGAQALTAVYYGDPVTAPASSAPTIENVGDFSVAVAAGTASTASILQGGTAIYSLVLTPLVLGTLPQGVVFTVIGLPKGATATFTPPNVAAGNAATPFVLTINTPAITASLHGQPRPFVGRLAPVALGLLLLPVAAFSRRRRVGKRLGSLLLLLLLAAGASGLTGCVSAASSGYYGVAPTTYNLTVTGTSGQLSRTTGVTLTIQ